MEYWKQELYHHGILGMKWGKRNGPPYPLDSSDHSVSERKAGWRKSLGGGRNPESYAYKKGLSDKQKRALKIAGMAVVGGAAIYGAYKYSQLKSNARPTIELGMRFVSSFNEKPQVHTVESIKIDPIKSLNKQEAIKKLAKKQAEREIESFRRRANAADVFKNSNVEAGREYADFLLKQNLETLRTMGY